MHARVYANSHVFRFRKHTHLHIYIPPCIHTCRCSGDNYVLHVHIHIHTYTYTYIRSHTHTRIHTYMYKNIRACTHAGAQRKLMPHMCIHTYIHAYTHADVRGTIMRYRSVVLKIVYHGTRSEGEYVCIYVYITCTVDVYVWLRNCVSWHKVGR